MHTSQRLNPLFYQDLSKSKHVVLSYIQQDCCNCHVSHNDTLKFCLSDTSQGNFCTLGHITIGFLILTPEFPKSCQNVVNKNL